MIPVADQYVEDVLSGKIPVCDNIRLAVACVGTNDKFPDKMKLREELYQRLKSRICVAAADLAATIDITALVLVFPPETETDSWYVLPYFWIPKSKYSPDFPVVSIVEAAPGRVLTASQLGALGLLAPSEPAIAPSVISLPALRRQRLESERHSPDYQRCLERAPLSKEHRGPDKSSADFDWCKQAARLGWSIEEIASKLLEVSEKARKKRGLGDPGYARITAKNAVDAVAAQGR